MQKNCVIIQAFLLLILLPVCSGAQVITTVVGNTIPGYGGDGMEATASEINQPDCISVDAAGNMYIADWANNRVRKVNTSGIITTIAGNGTPGYWGDGGQATAAELYEPSYVLADGAGNIYISDSRNYCIRKINTSGIISTIAGIGGSLGYAGDTGPATAALLNIPYGLVMDAGGNLYVADRSNHCVRKISTSGVITTIAGNGTPGFTGDGVAAASTELYQPNYLCLDLSGNLVISDNGNQRIRKVNASGIITTIAGIGTLGSAGDMGMATAAQLSWPAGLKYDPAGNLYIADAYNYKVRKVNTSGIITTVAGTGTSGYTGDGGPALIAELGSPYDICFDAGGNLLIDDYLNNCIRKIESCVNTITAAPVNDTVFSGLSATYSVTTTMASPAYQWQEDPGTGFVDLANVWPYSGVTTNTLTIHNASIFLNTTHYRCVITNETICADTSAGAILIIKDNTGISNVSSNMGIALYPNPVTETLTVSATDKITGVVITNILGVMVSSYKCDATAVQVNVAGLPAGIYFVKVNGSVMKFVKQ